MHGFIQLSLCYAGGDALYAGEGEDFEYINFWSGYNPFEVDMDSDSSEYLLNAFVKS
jgi:hypothetical protein